MDPEQTFIRVQERFSQVLTPRLRAALEYVYLFIAVTLFCILVVMHANYVQQPGCSSEFAGVKTADAQLFHIKITSVGLWSQNVIALDRRVLRDSEHAEGKVEVQNVDGKGLTLLAAKYWLNWIASGVKRGNLVLKFWKTDNELSEHQVETFPSSQNSKSADDEAIGRTDNVESQYSFPLSAKETFKAAIAHLGRKWYRRLSFIWRLVKQIVGSFWKLWNIAGVHFNIDIPTWLQILHLDRINLYAVQLIERRIKAFEPTYMYTMEKGYFLLPENAKTQHNIRTVNISISGRHSCFGNRWQQLLINGFVGYDTILMNSLLNSSKQGYLYNYQTKEFFNLSYAQPPEGPARFGDYFVTKCGVLMMSLFVFFTTTMSVSFTLRETQTRMLKFTVQLQHHARHRLPTFQLIFVHVIESLVFVPIMIGILFFLFEFYDDQLLAFMVLILVWLCELFTLISVRTPISMKFFPRFFLLYFLVFHIYFFSYSYGFSYLALSTTAAFMQHLILYFWNRFEVPALQRFMQNRRSQLQQHPDFHITSSTILASTFHITRLNTRNAGPANADMITGPGPGQRHGLDLTTQENTMRNSFGLQEQAETDNAGQHDLRQAEGGANPGTMNSFSSLLLWILGGASSEGLNSIFSMFRDVRDQGQVYAEPPRHDNRTTPNAQ